MIQFFKRLSLTARVRWFISLFATVLFLILAIYIVSERKKNIENKTDDFVFSNLNFLKSYAQHNATSLENEKQLIFSLVDTLDLQVNRIEIPDSINLNLNIDTLVAPYKTAGKIVDELERKNAQTLEDLFFGKRYIENGYAMLLDPKGNFLIHPSLQGESIRKTKLFTKIINFPNRTGKFEYEWPETEAAENHILYFSYSAELDAYVMITIFQKDVYTGNWGIFLFLLLFYVIVIAALNLIIWFIVKNLNHWLKKLDKIIAEMAKGKVVDAVEYGKENEIGRIITSLNTLIETSTRTAEFAKEITKGNLSADYKVNSKEDVLGNALLDMRESLVLAKEEEEKRKIEDDKQKWITSGLAKFGDILRQDNDNIENLTYNLINNLVKYMNANQGGIFIQQEAENNDVVYELKSAVAYNKRKYISKTIESGEGLIGRCVQEKSTIYLTEVPDNYIEISSGMGHAKPKSILITPLKVDNKLYGVVEIASFNELAKHEIQFVEKIAENIASTIASVKINLKTAELLKESEKQSKRLEQQEEDMRLNLQELQRTQELAAKNEETALGFVNAVNHTIIRADYDLDGKLTYANTKLLESMEYSSTEVKGVHYSFFMQKKDMKSFDEAWQRLIKGGTHYEEEVEYKTKFGKIWLLATYTAVRDRKGNVVKILYLAIDISNEKKVSINYENDMKAINASILKSEYKPDGTIVDDNDIFLETLGYRRADTVGKNLFDFLDNEKQKTFNNIWAQVLSGIAVDNIEKINTKTGEEKWFKGTYTPVKNTNNEVYKIIYIANEITQQKRLEDETRKRNNELLAQEKELQENVKKANILAEKMEENEAEMKGLLSAIDASTYSMELNLENKILKVNNSYAEIFKLSENEFLNKKDKDLFLMANPQNADNYEKLWNEVKFGLTKRATNRVFINNVEAWFVETYTPIFDADKNVTKILKLSTDVTQSKKLEIEASKQAKELREQEAEIINKVQELEIAQKEMEEMRQKEEVRNKETMETIEKHRKTLTDIIDNVPGKIFVKDNEGKMLIVNDAVAKVHGMPKDELIGMSDFDFFDKDTANKLWAEELQIINGKTKTYTQEEELSGETRILQTTKMPFYISYLGVKGLLGVQTDITELKSMEMEAKSQNEALLAQEEELRQNLEELQATQENLELKAKENEQMQVSLQKEKALLDTLLENIPDAIYFKDTECKFIRASKSIAKNVGVKSMEDLIGKSDHDFFEKESADEYYEEEQNLMKTGEAIIEKLTTEKRKDGRLTYALSTKMPMLDAEGNTIGTFGISKDITEIKELENQTQQQKQFLESIIDAMPGRLFIKDHEGKIITCNKAVADSYSLTKEEIIGKSAFDLINIEQAKEYWAEEVAVMKNNKPLKTVYTEQIKGEKLIFQTTKLPFLIPFTGKTGILGMQNDITEMKTLEEEAKQQAEELLAQEEELRQNLEELQAIQEDLMNKNEQSEKLQADLAKEKYLLDAMLANIPDMIYFKDLKSNFIRVSESMLNLFHLNKQDEIIGKSDFDFHGEHARVAYQDEQNIIKTGSPLIDVVQKEEHRDGRVIWMTTTKMPLRNEKGEIVGTFGISKDITKIKELELETQKKNNELATQEEELRQNLEEMEAIQEDLIRKKEEGDRLQQDLEKEKYLLDAMLTNVPDLIYFKDLKSNFIRVSDSMVKLFRAKSQDELIGKSDFDFHGEHARVAYQDEQNIINTGSPLIDVVQKEEHEHLGEVWMTTTKLPLRNQKGEIVGTFGISKDITHIKKLELEMQKKNNELATQEEELRQNLEEMEAIQEDLVRKHEESEKLKNELTKEKYLFDAVLKNVPDPIYFKDKESKFIRVNQAMVKIFGVNSEDDLIGKSDFDFFGKHAEVAYQDEQNIIRTGKAIYNVEQEEKRKDGRTHWMSNTKMPLLNEKNETVGTFGISRDITEQKELEFELKNQNEELAAQEEELRQHLEESNFLKEEFENEKKLLDTLLKTLPDAIYFKDTNHVFTRVSSSHAKMFGFSNPKELIGKASSEFMDAESAKLRMLDDNKIISSGEPILNREEKTNDETGEKWFLTSKMPLYDSRGTIIGTYGISRDITEQKQLELKTKHQKEFFQSIIDRMPNKVFVKDHEGKMIFVNEEVARVHGTTKEALFGKSDFDFFDKAKAQSLWKEEQDIIKNGSQTTVHEDTISGESQVLQTTKMPFDLPHLGKVGLLGIQNDITDIKRMEEAANQQAEELLAQEEELRQNLEELQAIQEDLMKKNEDNEKMKVSLAKESSLLNALLSTLPEAIYFKDKESKIIKASNQMAKNFGLKSAEELIGKSDFELLPYEAAEITYNSEQKIIRTAQGIENFIERDANSENERWLSTTKMPLMMNDKIIGTFGISRDVTQIKVAQREAKEQAEELKSINEEQTKIERELRWEKQMFNTLMKALTARVTFKDLTGKYVRINKAKAEMLNLLDAQEAIGKNDLDYFDRKLALKQREIEEKVIKNGEVFSNFVNKTEYPSGEIVWGDSNILPIHDDNGELMGLLDFTRDITKLKESEFKLSENEFKINGVVTKAPIMVFKINKLGNFTELRGMATKVFKTPQNELVGSSVFDLFPELSAVIHRGLGDKTHSFTKEFKADNSEIEVEFVLKEHPENEKVYFGYAVQKSGNINLPALAEINKVKQQIKNLKKKK